MRTGPFLLFKLQRQAGAAILLHPFLPGSAVFRAQPEGIEFAGLWSGEGEGEEPLKLRERLHAALERGARADALERGFGFRLLAAAGAFLALYIFLQIVVRDPVPMIDELLVGGSCAAALWFWLERRTLASRAFADRVSALRDALDRAYFRPSRAVALLEEHLEDAAALPPEAFASWIAMPSQEALDEATKADLDALCAAIEDRLYGESALKAARGLSEPGADRERLLKRIARSTAKAELPLLLAYSRARAGVEAAK